MLGTLLVAQVGIASYGSAGLGVDIAETGEPAGHVSSSELPEDIKRASEAADIGGNVGTGINITSAVFSQAEDPASGIAFTYRIGVAVVACFGASVVHYVMSNTTTLQLVFPGSNVIVPRGVDPLASKTNYFHGSDPSKWRAGLTDFGGVLYEGIYPGIDLKYKTVSGSLKYEFIVHAGADPAQIKMEYIDAENVIVQPGEVCVEAGGATMRDSGLVAYQETNGAGRQTVPCAFVQQSVHGAGFSLGSWDHGRDLVIDPVNILAYSTFIGGGGSEIGRSIDVENVFAYVTGFVYPYSMAAYITPFPTTENAYSWDYINERDIFVVKLSVDGGALLYSTLLGGDGDDYAYDIAVENGVAYITGYTNSSTFPTTAGAYNRTYNDGAYQAFDVFVTKISADGSALAYSTFLGGNGPDYGYSIAVENGFAYVTGGTGSTTFPTTPGAYINKTTNSNVFVTKLSADGSALIYSACFGGGFNNVAYGIAVEDGSAYITGFTVNHTNPFPTTPGAYDRTHNGGEYDVFVTKLSSDGSALNYSTLIGGVNYDIAYAISVENGFAYVTGVTGGTAATAYPTTPGAYNMTLNKESVFVTKFSANGNALVYSTIFGGAEENIARDIAVENGFAYITGYTKNSSFNYPTTAGAYDTTHNGLWDVFITKFSVDGNTLAYSTLLGENSTDQAYGIAVEYDAAYITGTTWSCKFPRTMSAYDITYNGGSDLFVTKLTGDDDDDGILNDWEIAHGMNPQANDTGSDLDGDGLTNMYEFLHGTRPDREDTDGDGMFDGWEVIYGLNPLVNDAGGDLDADGLDNLQEFLLATNPNLADSDGDAMPDGWEVEQSLNAAVNDAAGDADDDGLLNLAEYQAGTNATNSDTDGDGMLDGWEVSCGLHPLTNDAGGDLDADGLTNLREFKIGTLPNCVDTDCDGRPDGLEITMAYDPLVPDVQHRLEFSTYIGGNGEDSGYSIVVDNGAIYVTGCTYSDPFPTTSGANDTIFNSGSDVFVAKLSIDGSTLLYSTYIGGSGNDLGRSIAVDKGVAYITGYTYSNPFPTTAGASDRIYNGGMDVFITKLSTDGSVLLYSTYIGGDGNDFGRCIAVENGSAYITGETWNSTTNYPTTPGVYNTEHNGGTDAFVTKLSADGGSLVYSTFLGGSNYDYGYGIAVENRFAYIVGYTVNATINYPTTSGAYSTTYNGGSNDVFVTKLSADGSTLVYSTFIGSNGTDQGFGIDVDNGVAYIIGATGSSSFPTTIGAYDSIYNGGMWDTFVTKLSTDGSSLLYSTYIGGSENDVGRGIFVDSGAVYITGTTQSSAFPTTAGAYDTTLNGTSGDAFVTVFSSNSSILLYSTIIGGSGSEIAYGIATENGAAFIIGYTNSNPYPTTAGAYDTTYNLGSFDVFVTKIAQDIDSDGMPDGWETSHSLSAQVDDSLGDLDADGLANLQEFQHATNPAIADSEGDGIPDGWEHSYTLNLHTNDAASDPDADGLTNVQEYLRGTNPGNNDTEGDTMLDGWEVINGLDPLLDDASFDDDGDGLVNSQENQHGTMPNNLDTDGDGASDGVEVKSGTDPLDPTDFPASVANDPTLLVLGIISLCVAGFACVLVILIFLNSKRAMEQLSREFREFRNSAGKAEPKGKGKGYTSVSDAKHPIAPDDSKAETTTPTSSPKDKGTGSTSASDAKGTTAPDDGKAKTTTPASPPKDKGTGSTSASDAKSTTAPDDGKAKTTTPKNPRAKSKPKAGSTK